MSEYLHVEKPFLDQLGIARDSLRRSLFRHSMQLSMAAAEHESENLKRSDRARFARATRHRQNGRFA